MNIKTTHISMTMILLAASFCGAATTQPVATTQPAAPQHGVAVLTFDSSLTEPKDSGRLIADILSARLSAGEDVQVVDRQDIEKILTEQKLTLSGLVSPQQAARVGQLLGAKLLITGRVTTAGSRLYVVCKGISTQTSRVKGFFLTLDVNSSFDDLVNKTGASLIESLPDWIRQLLPPEQQPVDLSTILKKILRDKRELRVAVVVPEMHIQQRVIDPAVETEIKTILTKAGVQPVRLEEKLLQKLQRNGRAEFRNCRYPGADYLIYGEAFSESGGQVYGLTVCAARVELEIINLRTGKTVLADSQTARVPDLAENLAGKSALQKATRILTRRMLPKFVKILPDAPKPRSKTKP